MVMPSVSTASFHKFIGRSTHEREPLLIRADNQYTGQESSLGNRNCSNGVILYGGEDGCIDGL